MFQLFDVSFEVYIIIAVIAILSFFFWRWIFRKAKIRRSSLWSVVVSVVTAPVVYTLLFMCWFWVTAYYPDKSFDKAAWQANKEERYEYAHDLLERKLIDAKTKDEVIAILGEPDHDSETTFYYNLGFKPGLFNIDPYYMMIEFKNGRVSSVSERSS